MNLNLVLRNGRLTWRVGIDNIIQGYNSISGFPATNEKFLNPTLVLAGEHSLHTVRSKALVNEVTLDQLYCQMFPNVQIDIVQKAGHWLHA